MSNEINDEQIIKQQEEIEKEISTTTPLLSQLLPLSDLLPEYNHDAVYSQKIKTLLSSYNSIRKTRPDGNCFYRAFLFGLFDQMTKNAVLLEKITKKYKELKPFLEKAGYTQFTVDDFYEFFGTALETLATTTDLLAAHFSSDSHSDYLIVFLRLLTSAELRNNAEFYQNFIEGQTVEEFTKLEVEPMYKESDHIHIIALATLLDVGVRIVYLDRGEKIVIHDFPEGKDVVVEMLYRPGHYDVVYKLE